MIKKYNKKDTKWLIILFLSMIIIALNFLMFTQRKQKLNSKLKNSVNLLSYYDTDFKGLVLYSQKGVLKLPDYNNILLIGIDGSLDQNIQIVTEYFKKFNLSDFDIEVLLVSNNYQYDNDKVTVYSYQDRNFEKHYQLNEDSNFIILIDATARVKYYKNYIDDLGIIKHLLERYRSGDSI